MATAQTKYFSGDVELTAPFGLDNRKFANAFPGVKGRKYDSFNRLVGTTISDAPAVMPVDRVIFFKKNPSLHKCDHRCRHAKGGNCECSCGGKFHGTGG